MPKILVRFIYNIRASYKTHVIKDMEINIHERPDIINTYVIETMGVHYSRSRIHGVVLDQNYSGLFFFSSSQLHNPDVNLSRVAAKYHLKIPFDICGEDFGRVTHVRGLVCVTDKHILEAKKETVRVFFNPSTRESLILPKVKTRNVTAVMKTSLGYDPNDKKFKVLLSMTSKDFRKDKFEEKQVLTLGTGTWRMFECCIPHYYVFQEICINWCYLLSSYHFVFEDRYDSVF